MELYKTYQIGRYEIDQRAQARWLIEFTTKGGKRLAVELVKCTTPEKLTKSCIMYMWVKNGRLPAVLPSYWAVSTYAYDNDGNCWGWYNPQEIDYKRTDKNGKVTERRPVICFDWVLEATEQNAKKILDEIERRADADIKTVKDYKTVA